MLSTLQARAHLIPNYFSEGGSIMNPFTEEGLEVQRGLGKLPRETQKNAGGKT